MHDTTSGSRARSHGLGACTMPFEDLQWDVKDPILAPRRILQAEPCVRLKGIASSRFDRKRGGSRIRPF